MGKIKFEKVTFTYPLAEQAALKGITFEIEEAQIYCHLRKIGVWEKYTAQANEKKHDTIWRIRR